MGGWEGGDANLYRYAGGDSVNSIDPTGLDIWIEGASGSEIWAHQSINIGDQFGEYASFSFAINGGGRVYSDEEQGGEILRYLKTTPRNLSTRVRQQSWEFYEGKAAFAASVSRRGVLAVA